MNSWASAAAKQLFQNWSRCGVTYLPKATDEGVQRANAWLEDQNLQLGVEEAQRLGLHGNYAQNANTAISGTNLSVAESLTTTSSVPSLNPELDAPATHSTSANLADSIANSLRAPAATTSNPTTADSKPANQSTLLPRPTAATTRSSLGSTWGTKPLDITSRNERFQLLAQQVASCKLCTEIACRRNKTVFGAGPSNARIVMFGEAPGADEDRAGEPFVGAAGQLMDKILAASGLKREEVFIMNSLKCRPPNNRTPTDTEIENCRPFFETQLELIQPDYIVCWGAVAVRAILKRTDSIGRLRGAFHQYKGAKVLVTYHPAYLLRNPDAKKLTWEDMKFLMKELGIPIPPPRKPNA